MLKIFFVLGFFSLIITVMLFAADPAGQLASANNTKRNQDIITIINAIYQYSADNGGKLPDVLPDPGSPRVKIAKDGADLCSMLVPKYLENLPSDPDSISSGSRIECGEKYDTGYTIELDFLSKKITLSAPLTQKPLETVLSVTR